MEKEESRIIDKSLIYARAQAKSSRKIELPYHSPNYTLIKRPQKDILRIKCASNGLSNV